MSNKTNDSTPANSTHSVDGIAQAGTPSDSAPAVETLWSPQILLATISNDSIPQKYLDVAKLMMLSKTMFTIYSSGAQAFVQVDKERTMLNEEIENLKTKGTADEMKIFQLESDKVSLEQKAREMETANQTKISQLECDKAALQQRVQELEAANQTKISQLECKKAALEQKVQELEAANQTTTAEKKKLATNLEVCEEKLEKTTARIQDLEVGVKEKDTEIEHFKTKVRAFEVANEKSNSLFKEFLEAKMKSEEAISSMDNHTVPKEEISDKENVKRAGKLNAAKVEQEKKGSKRQAKKDDQNSKKGKFDVISD